MAARINFLIHGSVFSSDAVPWIIQAKIIFTENLDCVVFALYSKYPDRKIKMTRMLKRTIMSGLEKISTKFPSHDKLMFCSGLNLNQWGSISNLYFINEFEIIIFIIWSIIVKHSTGAIKGLNCLILTPPIFIHFCLLLSHQRQHQAKDPMQNCLIKAQR